LTSREAGPPIDNFMTAEPIDTQTLPVGVVGLGLMGCSITTCLLMAGHPVVAVAPVPGDLAHAEQRVLEHLQRSQSAGLIAQPAAHYLSRLLITEDYSLLSDCRIVIECTLENLEIKSTVYRKIESVIDEKAILTSNTSAIPISILQAHTTHPARFFVLHWAEPSHTTRFLEIICG